VYTTCFVLSIPKNKVQKKFTSLTSSTNQFHPNRDLVNPFVEKEQKKKNREYRMRRATKAYLQRGGERDWLRDKQIREAWELVGFGMDEGCLLGDELIRYRW